MSSLTRRWQRVPLAWRRAVFGTVALWAVVLAVTVLAAGTLPARPFSPDPGVPGFPGWPAPGPDASGGALLRDALVRFDALYYLGIAADGYPTGGVATGEPVPNAFAFFPAYPALVAGTAALTGGRVLLAAMLVSTAATCLALAGIHRLAEVVLREDDQLAPAGHRAVVLTVLFPTSFFLLAPYAESVHLAAVVWALLAAARDRPWTAAVLGAVAAAARPVGVVLALPLLLVLRDEGTWPSRVRRVAAAAGPVVGGLAVLLLGWLHTGSWLAPLAAQARWQREWQWPWRSAWDAVRFALADPGVGSTGYQLLDLVVVAVALAASLALLSHVHRARGDLADGTRPLGVALLLHAALTFAVWFAQPFPARPLLSVSRFALVVPAVLVGLAAATARPSVERVWTSTSTILLTLHLALFSRWWFVF